MSIKAGTPYWDYHTRTYQDSDIYGEAPKWSTVMPVETGIVDNQPSQGGLLSPKIFWSAAFVASASAALYYFSRQPTGKRFFENASNTARETYHSIAGYLAQLVNCSKYYAGYLKLSTCDALFFANQQRDEIKKKIDGVETILSIGAPSSEMVTELEAKKATMTTALQQMNRHINAFETRLKANTALTDNDINQFQQTVLTELQTMAEQLNAPCVTAAAKIATPITTPMTTPPKEPHLNDSPGSSRSSTPNDFDRLSDHGGEHGEHKENPAQLHDGDTPPPATSQSNGLPEANNAPHTVLPQPTIVAPSMAQRLWGLFGHTNNPVTAAQTTEQPASLLTPGN